MDDDTTPPAGRAARTPRTPRCVVTHACEPSRLQGQLLARAYQHVLPEARRRLCGRVDAPAVANAAPARLGPFPPHVPTHVPTAARAAAGA
jgi:hypothetical protein